MGPRLMKWLLCAGLASVLLFALPILPSVITGASIVSAAEKTEPLDINAASAEQLKALPGIGDAYSEKIIKGQPYQRKDELVQKKVLPRATYEQIKYNIAAKQKSGHTDSPIHSVCTARRKAMPSRDSHDL